MQKIRQNIKDIEWLGSIRWDSDRHITGGNYGVVCWCGDGAISKSVR